MFVANPTTFEDCTPVALRKAPVAPPQTRTLTGLVAGTLVETETGWRPVETLRQGERVQTYDGGLQMVRSLSSTTLSGGSVAAKGLLHVPGGALDNCEDLWLMDDQQVLIESEISEKLLGTATVLVPARALEGYRGIERLFGGRPTEVFSMGFEDEELVYGNSGVLFHCAPAAATEAATSGFFTCLSAERAQALLSLIEADPALLPRAFARMHDARMHDAGMHDAGAHGARIAA